MHKKLLFKITRSEPDFGPSPDLAYCDEDDCDWQGLVSECKKEIEGDWETGYYEIDVCPECGGPVEYDMSEARAKEWEAWYEYTAGIEKIKSKIALKRKEI